MQKFYCSFFFVMMINICTAQSSWRSFWKLSCPEKMWIITHPFVAKKAFRISLEARSASNEMTKDTMLDGDPSGGQVDAFRHAYWMARLSQEMCWRKAIALGKAHEKGEYRKFKKTKMDEEGELPDSVSGAMDLYNNKVGTDVGCHNKNVIPEKIIELIKMSVLKGEMKIILKNSKGIPVNCQGEILVTPASFHQWNLPKCLVQSDFPHVE